MINPLFRDNDSIRQGATYMRRYNTGTLDTTDMTPRITLLHRRDGTEVTNAFQVARLTGTDYDSRYDWALVIARDVTSQLDPTVIYVYNVDFDQTDGTTIPHGAITCTVIQGVPHP
jgi:hypothetical protein